MYETDEWRAYVVHLRAEHRRLHEAVRHIQSLLSRWPEPNVRDELTSRMADLRRELAHHFDDEEQGGCIEEAVSRVPALSAAAHNIESQHPELLKQLDHMFDCVGYLQPTSFKEEFDGFAKQLLAHEALENQLIERGFNVNLESDYLD